MGKIAENFNPNGHFTNLFLHLHTKKKPPIRLIFRNPCTFQNLPTFLKSSFLVDVGELWNFPCKEYLYFCFGQLILYLLLWLRIH